MSRLLLVLLPALAGCFPQFEDTPWLVTEPRILAVRGDPAEAEPLTVVRFEALVASPQGESFAERIEWSFCLRPRTLAERNGVAPECLAAEGDAIQLLESRVAEIPLDACARFGPNPPPSEPDAPPLRPADPDTTGGYYLPVRAAIPEAGTVAFGFERLRCALAGAPREIFTEYQARYSNNTNPAIEAIELVEGDVARPLESGSTVGVGAQVTLRVRTSTASLEPYVQYDATAGALRDRVETMIVSWFSSAGSFELERSGLDEDEVQSGLVSMENRWTAPDQPGAVRIWLVLRDARGGTDWRELELEVP